MTGDEARERFGAAYDGGLPPEEREAFDRALAEDPALREAYARYEQTLREVARLEAQTPETPDVLSGVQAKLKARSGGRYYRDRFARRVGLGWNMPMIVAGALLVLLAIGWWGLWHAASP
jgi:anti-sigma factor RsiW